jgi:hypothetical protein
VINVRRYDHSEAGAQLLDMITEDRFSSATEPHVDLLPSVVMNGAGSRATIQLGE